MRVPTLALVSLALLAAVPVAEPAGAAPGKSSAIERQIDVGSFTGVALEGAMDVRILQGDRTRVLARGSQAALDSLVPRVEDGVLRLKQRDNVRLPAGDRLLVTVTMPTLNSLLLAGSGNVSIDRISTDKLELKLAGSGDITANGTCRILSINVAGSGEVKTENLHCDTVAVRIAGSGDVTTHAREAFSARIMGSGDIDVYGNPKNRSRTVLGSGNITYHDGDAGSRRR